jgi:hypothetical protein
VTTSLRCSIVSGFTLGLAGSVGDAINGTVAQGQALASGNSDARATALHSIAAGGDAAMAGKPLVIEVVPSRAHCAAWTGLASAIPVMKQWCALVHSARFAVDPWPPSNPTS